VPLEVVLVAVQQDEAEQPAVAVSRGLRPTPGPIRGELTTEARGAVHLSELCRFLGHFLLYRSFIFVFSELLSGQSFNKRICRFT
jgi:hypothetical protein